MSTAQTILAVIGGLVVLAAVAGGLWAVFRSSAQDARIKQLSSWNTDLIARVNYLEPQVASLKQQNELLLEMHNPADQITKLAAQEQRNHDATVAVLGRIETALRSR